MNPSANDNKPKANFLKIISFTEKIGFICNLFFLASVIARYVAPSNTIIFQGLIIILGMVLSPTVNVLLFMIHLFQIFNEKTNFSNKKLAFINTALFILQIIYLFS